jgi:fructokinase
MLRKVMIKPAIMIGLGEVLWDLLPSGKALGGAPANFAYMANVLGDQGIVASRVGNDELGKEARAVMQGLGLSTSYVQQDDQHQTGTAGVHIDSGGQPTFTIKESVSWDFLLRYARAAFADFCCYDQRVFTSGTKENPTHV